MADIKAVFTQHGVDNVEDWGVGKWWNTHGGARCPMGHLAKALGIPLTGDPVQLIQQVEARTGITEDNHRDFVIIWELLVRRGYAKREAFNMACLSVKRNERDAEGELLIREDGYSYPQTADRYTQRAQLRDTQVNKRTRKPASPPPQEVPVIVTPPEPPLVEDPLPTVA